MAHELRRVIEDMDRKDEAGKSGFENQFEVYTLIEHPVLILQDLGLTLKMNKSCDNVIL